MNKIKIKSGIFLGFITLFIAIIGFFNLNLILSIQGKKLFNFSSIKKVLYSIGIVDLKNAPIEVIAKIALPDENDSIRPIKIDGKPIKLSLEKENLDLIMSKDPFPPNGPPSFPPFGEPVAPDDLTDSQKDLYNKIVYGTKQNNFQDAVGGCVYCNAPAGAGGCFKKRVLRALTYVMVKQGYTEKQIIDELRIWMKFFFPGLAIKWTKYYLDQGIDPDKIPIDVKTFSLQGKRKVELALKGKDFSQIPEEVGGCFR